MGRCTSESLLRTQSRQRPLTDHSIVADATTCLGVLDPALKDRAKFTPPLRGEKASEHYLTRSPNDK